MPAEAAEGGQQLESGIIYDSLNVPGSGCWLLAGTPRCGFNLPQGMVAAAKSGDLKSTRWTEMPYLVVVE